MVDFSVLKVAESEVMERKTWHLQDVGEVLSSSLISILEGSIGLSCPYFSPWAIHLFKRFIEDNSDFWKKRSLGLDQVSS